MGKYNNKYRIVSARLQHWDYRWSGAYFITICTQNREHFFGKIVGGKRQWSHVGIIAHIVWDQISYHTRNVELGEFIVMPNHIHGIVIINDDNVNNDNVEIGHALSLHPSIHPPTIGQQRFQNIGKNSISTIIRSYKSAVTKYANRLELAFQWQTRFHDHIIRDNQSCQLAG